jgi:uncharacterized integral membrane protein
MARKLINLIILVPIAIILIVMSVANRQAVNLAFNPFDPGDTMLSVSAPFFVYIFIALIVGILIGSGITWIAQGKHRKRAKSQKQEATKWQGEARRHQKRAEELAQQTLVPVSSSN